MQLNDRTSIFEGNKLFIKRGSTMQQCCLFIFFFSSHVINVKDAKDFLKDQDPVHGVMKGENRKSKAGGYLAELIMCLPLFG